MHVGLSVFFQNLVAGQSDAEVYDQELALADLAEPLGFDSVWSAEHHFTDYTMCPSVIQFLTWVAGRTERVGLGSMVVVLPWHDPVRVAEGFSVLDHVSGGRAILGIGRGLGRVEFEGFRTAMAESRPRFIEYAQALLQGLERGVIDYQGEVYQQPPAPIRPKPLRSFRGRTYASAVSPESARIMAELGVGIMIIAQKPSKIAARIAKHGPDDFARFLADLQVWGTPDQVTEQMIEHQRMLGSEGVIGVFGYGGMPRDVAKANVQLFADQVLPRLKAHQAS